jgi:penicillin-binding protein 1C
MSLKFSGAVRDFFTQLNKFFERLKKFISKSFCLKAQERGDSERRSDRIKLFVITRVLVIILAFLALFWLVLRFSPYPDLKNFLARPNSVCYYDRSGLLLQITPLSDGLRREKPAEFPMQVKDIFVFAEDRRFYRHFGVDGVSMIRAVYQNIAHGRRVSGASTITMQLARIISDNGQSGAVQQKKKRQTILSKIGEMLNALRLETRLSKEQILELYLLSLPFGHNTEGVASAARTFFASDISMLSPAQIFCLAVIPRRPGMYNPLENPETCIAAAAELHERFVRTEALSKRKKSAQPLLAQINDDDWKFASFSAKRFEYPLELPHLIRNINSANTKDEVNLSIDLSLQHYLENAIAGNVMRYYFSRLTNGSCIVIDNETGEILAWVGSADFFNTADAGQVDGVLALNQPGSSMKPFLYAMALENGFKPTDVIADIQMTYGESEIYIPRNFNEKYNGPILIRAALASSLNIPAVYLLYRLSVRKYSDLLLSLGFDSLEYSAEDAGLGLALGNAPVSLLELVRAFSVFPRDGIFLPLTWELQAEVKQKDESQKRIFSADTSRIICSFLSDSNARVLAFGFARNFRTSFPAIFKTGTANQYQSIVALGATQKYTVGVWMGNFTGETVIGKTGSSIPAAIVRDTLILLEEKRGMYIPDFPAPENWQLKRVCALSGMTPTDACLSVVNEYVQTGDDGMFCTWHQNVNGRSVTVFPAEYQSWFAGTQRQGAIDYASRPLEIVTPRSGFVYLTNPGIGMDDIPVEIIGGENDESLVTHNGNVIRVRRPFVFYLPRKTGVNTLSVRNGDEEQTVVFTVEN